MLRYTLVRLAQAILVLWVVVTVVFLLSRASGNVAELMVPPDAPPEIQAQIEENLGLDKPLIVQYVDYMGDLAHGDLGQSFAYRTDVRSLIIEALPNTIELGSGRLRVRRRRSASPRRALGDAAGRGTADKAGKGLALAGQSVPIVLARHPAGAGVLGAARLAAAVRARGAGSTSCCRRSPSAWYPLASLTRLTRSAVLEVLRKDHTAVPAGQGRLVQPRWSPHDAQRLAADRHAGRDPARHAVLRCAVIVETMFAWPGVGQLAIQGINSRDYNVVQGVVLVNTAIFVVLLFLVDISYGVLDPRVRSRTRGAPAAG